MVVANKKEDAMQTGASGDGDDEDAAARAVRENVQNWRRSVFYTFVGVAAQNGFFCYFYLCGELRTT